MRRASISYGACILTAFLLLAGAAAANPIALFDGGAKGEGEASGSYYVDATGALDHANGATAHYAEVVSTAKQADAAYVETRDQIWNQARATEAPEIPECPCDEVFGQLEQVGSMEVAHADSVTKAADLETGIVDAGVDASAAGGVQAWFSDLFKGAGDAFDGLKGLFGVDASAKDDVVASADTLVGAEDELRGELINTLDQNPQLPNLDPRVSGDLAGQHTTELTSSVLGEVQGGLP